MQTIFMNATHRITNEQTGKVFKCVFNPNTKKFYPVDATLPMFWQRDGDRVVCPIWSDEPHGWVCEQIEVANV